MKFEVVITVWDDGVFKLRDRTEAVDINELSDSVENLIDEIGKKLEADEERRRKIMEDDDIPF